MILKQCGSFRVNENQPYKRDDLLLDQPISQSINSGNYTLQTLDTLGTQMVSPANYNYGTQKLVKNNLIIDTYRQISKNKRTRERRHTLQTQTDYYISDQQTNEKSSKNQRDRRDSFIRTQKHNSKPISHINSSPDGNSDLKIQRQMAQKVPTRGLGLIKSLRKKKTNLMKRIHNQNEPIDKWKTIQIDTLYHQQVDNQIMNRRYQNQCADLLTQLNTVDGKSNQQLAQIYFSKFDKFLPASRDQKKRKKSYFATTMPTNTTDHCLKSQHSKNSTNQFRIKVQKQMIIKEKGINQMKSDNRVKKQSSKICFSKVSSNQTLRKCFEEIQDIEPNRTSNREKEKSERRCSKKFQIQGEENNVSISSIEMSHNSISSSSDSDFCIYRSELDTTNLDPSEKFQNKKGNKQGAINQIKKRNTQLFADPKLQTEDASTNYIIPIRQDSDCLSEKQRLIRRASFGPKALHNFMNDKKICSQKTSQNSLLNMSIVSPSPDQRSQVSPSKNESQVKKSKKDLKMEIPNIEQFTAPLLLASVAQGPKTDRKIQIIKKHSQQNNDTSKITELASEMECSSKMRSQQNNLSMNSENYKSYQRLKQPSKFSISCNQKAGPPGDKADGFESSEEESKLSAQLSCSSKTSFPATQGRFRASNGDSSILKQNQKSTLAVKPKKLKLINEIFDKQRIKLILKSKQKVTKSVMFKEAMQQELMSMSSKGQVGGESSQQIKKKLQLRSGSLNEIKKPLPKLMVVNCVATRDNGENIINAFSSKQGSSSQISPLKIQSNRNLEYVSIKNQKQTNILCSQIGDSFEIQSDNEMVDSVEQFRSDDLITSTVTQKPNLSKSRFKELRTQSFNTPKMQKQTLGQVKTLLSLDKQGFSQGDTLYKMKMIPSPIGQSGYTPLTGYSQLNNNKRRTAKIQADKGNLLLIFKDSTMSEQDMQQHSAQKLVKIRSCLGLNQEHSGKWISGMNSNKVKSSRALSKVLVNGMVNQIRNKSSINLTFGDYDCNRPSLSIMSCKNLNVFRDDSSMGCGNGNRKKPPQRRQSSVVSTTNVRTFKNKQDGHKMINQYKVIKNLGSGSFATVKLCQDIHNKEFFAIKQMNKKLLRKKITGRGQNAYDCVKEELIVLQRLEHPNIIWLHEIIDDPRKDYIYLVTEYHSKGSLADLLKKKNDKYSEFNRKCIEEGRKSECIHLGLSPNTLRPYFQDMLKALYYCHKVIKVIHRDIKPENIMINHNDEAVLIDFGVSALIDDQEDDQLNNKTQMGSYIFYSPEMWQRSSKNGNSIRGELTDLWALGVTLYKLVTGRYPFEEAQNPMQLKELIVNQQIDFKVIKNKQVRQLLKRILEKNPAKRATLEEILESSWITNDGKEQVDVKVVEHDPQRQQETGHSMYSGFGNILRLMKNQNQCKTIRNLLSDKECDSLVDFNDGRINRVQGRQRAESDIQMKLLLIQTAKNSSKFAQNANQSLEESSANSQTIKATKTDVMNMSCLDMQSPLNIKTSYI